MPKGRADPRKITNTKLLRQLKKAAKDAGFDFIGLDGTTHYLFAKDGRKVRAPRTPRVDDLTVLKRFQSNMERV